MDWSRQGRGLLPAPRADPYVRHSIPPTDGPGTGGGLPFMAKCVGGKKEQKNEAAAAISTGRFSESSRYQQLAAMPAIEVGHGSVSLPI